MTFSTILCPVDFSAVTTPLIQYAAVLARTTGALIELLHVVPGRAVDAANAWRHTREAAAEERLLQLAASPELAGLIIRTQVRFGDPDQVIVSVAAGEQADVIVIGAHGTTGLTRFLMGGTAESVLRTAPCPTLLVSLGPSAEAGTDLAHAA